MTDQKTAHTTAAEAHRKAAAAHREGNNRKAHLSTRRATTASEVANQLAWDTAVLSAVGEAEMGRRGDACEAAALAHAAAAKAHEDFAASAAAATWEPDSAPDNADWIKHAAKAGKVKKSRRMAKDKRTSKSKGDAKKSAGTRLGDGLCKCGCGGETKRHFKMGHDARYVGWMKKLADGRMNISELPAAVRKAAQMKQTESGWVPTVHYDGEPMGRRRYGH